MDTKEDHGDSTVVHSDPFRRYIVQEIYKFQQPTHVYIVEVENRVWDVDIATLDYKEALQQLEMHEREEKASVITVKGLCPTWKSDLIRITMDIDDDGFRVGVSDMHSSNDTPECKLIKE
jgi:hypothetical protein